MYRGIQRVKNVRVTHGSSLARSAYPARPVGLARKLNNVMAELSQYEVPFLFCSVGLPNQNSNGLQLTVSFVSIVRPSDASVHWYTRREFVFVSP